jgi:A/G-specific adenine glycosylase
MGNRVTSALKVQFRSRLLAWYGAHARVLPWRQERDAYRVWLSEIIMQQTRVEQGTPYFERILEAFPTVNAMAAASEDQVLRLWQGLGYYSRARNMLATARVVAEVHGGIFPEDYAAVRALKGIGDYTAAAILSIACNQPFAAVDGNIARVLSRVFALDSPAGSPAARKALQAFADQLLDVGQPGAFNEALMEVGAMVCTPRNPKCTECALAEVCAAHLEGREEEFPVKRQKLKNPEIYLHYFVIHDGGGLVMKKREGSAIWKGLYDFPLLETQEPGLPDANEIEKKLGLRISDVERIHRQKHDLTHRRLHISYYRCMAEGEENGCYLRVPIREVDAYPVPRPVELFLSLLKKNAEFA